MQIKVLFTVLFFFLSLSSKIYAQNEQTEIEIGKRKNILFDREIKAENMGSWYAAAQPIYFRAAYSEEKHRRIGFMGRRLKPYLQANPAAYVEFQEFRQKRILARTCEYATLGAMYGWSYRVIDNLIDRRANTLQGALTEPVALILAASSLSLSIGAQTLHLQSSKDLFNSVQIYNGRAFSSHQPTRIEVGIRQIYTPIHTALGLGFTTYF